MSGAISIRQATSVDDVKVAMGWMMSSSSTSEEEEWIMVKADVELFYAIYPQGFYLGEVAGGKVSHVSAIMYGDDEFCHIGLFIVVPEQRKRGYGKKTWDYAWEKIPERCECISIDAVVKMVPMYEKYGFKTSWIDYQWSCSAERITSLCVPLECNDLIFTSYKDWNFDALYKYDTSVFGYTRESFLKKLYDISEYEGWVISNPDGEILGYTILKKLRKSYGWFLAPWYANDISIARALLNRAVTFILSQSQRDCPSVISCIMPEVNQEGMEFVRSLAYEDLSCYGIQMFARSIPKVVVENSRRRIFGLSSPSVG